MTAEVVYDGRDPHFSSVAFCATCDLKGGDVRSQDGSVVKLLKCSQCHCIPYCSKRCQKSHWKEHKSACKAIYGAAAVLEKLAASLRSCKDYDECLREGPVNLFEAEVGKFWIILETREYIKARSELAQMVYELAFHEETLDLWEKARLHYQEILRLCANDNLGIRSRFVFLLIHMNLDDDAYCFAQYWTNFDSESYDDRFLRHKESKAGDWLYPREDGCRYYDFFDETDEEAETIELAFLVAVCVIKLRIVAAYDETLKHGIQSSTLQKERVKDNRRQIQVLLDQIHANNPSMLPAILNPEPFEKQGVPEYTQPGHASEAAMVLMDAYRAWVRIPGAEEIIRARLGPNPSYDHDISLPLDTEAGTTS
jgi:hypothetical protein